MTYNISPEQALQIINIACSTWKDKLAKLWGKNIVLTESIDISNEFYEEMRKACTTEQNKLFDEIFGELNPCPYKDGDLIAVKDYNNLNWVLRYATGKMINGNVEVYHNQKNTGNDKICYSQHIPIPNVKLHN